MKLLLAAAGLNYRRQLPRSYWIVFAAISLLAVLLRVNSGLGRDLWEDEIISALHAARSAWLMPVQVMRYDVHPFLYFFQLNLWTFLGDSDLVLRLNSTFWSLLGLVSLYVALRKLYGATTALIGYGLLAVSAPMVWLSQELRPYAWMSFLYIWAFYAIEMLSRSGFSSRRHFGWGWILCIALAYSHSLGALIVFLLGCYALTRIVLAGFDRRQVIMWMILFGSCAVLALPPVVNDLARDANLGGGGTFTDNLLYWPPLMLLPRGDNPALLVLAGLAYAGTSLLGVLRLDTRLQALTFLVAPIVMCLCLSALGLMMFKQNIFSLIANPLFAVVLARLLVHWRPVQAMAGASVAGALCLLFCASFFANRVPSTGYREAVEYIGARAEPSDLVYVPQEGMFYGLARYLSVWPQAVAARVGTETTARWQRVYDRLGPWFVSTFELEPKTQSFRPDTGPPILVGNDSAGIAGRARRVWLVTYPRIDLPPGFPPETFGSLHLVSEVKINFLEVRFYE